MLMRIHHFSILFVLSLCFSLYSTAANAHTFLTHPIKPFTYEENNEIKGFAVDVVKELMLSLNKKGEFKLYPFKRAFYILQNKDRHALFVLAKRPERESTVKWVGPIVSSDVYFYTKKNSPLNITSLADAKKLNLIGVGSANSDHVFLKKHGFENLNATTNQQQSIQMLNKGRIDATPMSELVFKAIMQDLKLDKKQIKRTQLKLYESKLYLGFSKDTSDKVIKKWQQALDNLKQSEKYQKILNKYLQY